MLIQILLGLLTTVLSIMATAACIALEVKYLKTHASTIASHRGLLRDAVLLGLVLLWMTTALGISVGLWTTLFLFVDAFGTIEEALYFAMVTFTTLGFGDVLMPDEWRLLSGFAASNGMVFFGLISATLFEVYRRLLDVGSQ